MMKRRTIVPSALKGVYRNWHFAPAVVVDGMVYCSGIIGTSADGEPPQRDAAGAALHGASQTTADPAAGIAALQAVRDPRAQFETAFEALAVILEAAGARLADIVEITSDHVDMARHMETFVAVRDRYLAEPWPAWTAIGVAELAVPGGLLELRAIAALPHGDGG